MKMVNYMEMIVVNIFEAKAKLSQYLEAVAGGERVLICKRNRPVAELKALEAARTEPRPVGVGRGLEVPPSFFEPLPDSLIDAFEGLEDLEERPKESSRARQVADRDARVAHGAGKPRRRGRRR